MLVCRMLLQVRLQQPAWPALHMEMTLGMMA